MPRLSLRRGFVYLILPAVFTLFLLINSQWSYPMDLQQKLEVPGNSGHSEDTGGGNGKEMGGRKTEGNGGGTGKDIGGGIREENKKETGQETGGGMEGNGEETGGSSGDNQIGEIENENGGVPGKEIKGGKEEKNGELKGEETGQKIVPKYSIVSSTGGVAKDSVLSPKSNQVDMKKLPIKSEISKPNSIQLKAVSSPDVTISPLYSENTVFPPTKDRPWYMKEGELRPQPVKINNETGEQQAIVFPEESIGHDRISDQLMYVPPKGAVPVNQDDSSAPLKKILLWNGSGWGGFRPGRGVFLKERCPVSTCVISSSRGEAADADLILFKDHFTMPHISRPPNQIWMIYLLECPMHTQLFKHKNVFNWTATYRTESTIVAPYERWQYYNENIKSKALDYNYAANKTKQVAWFVSNCGARNGRLPFARELGKYINVDIFGACGTKRCPRSRSDKCFDMLNKDYKFYLAFENSNCKDYITEKFFVNGLGNDILPIAMGARPRDYLRASPQKSFIHVDDFDGPKELAEYLRKLDNDDDLYNEYFKWKGTGEFVNTKFFCRVCALLHDPKVRSVENSYYSDINNWWRGDGTCVNGSWKRHKALSQKTEKKSLNGGSDNSSLPIQAPDVLVDK